MIDLEDQPEAAAEEPAAYLTFESGGAAFAAPVAAVREILDAQPLSPVPGAPPVVLGMIDLRGRPVVTVDGADILSVRGSLPVDPKRLVVFDLDGAGDGLIAVQVDHVRSVEAIDADEVLAPPGHAGRHVCGCVRRGGEVVLLLDLAAVLGPYSAGGERIDVLAYA